MFRQSSQKKQLCPRREPILIVLDIEFIAVIASPERPCNSNSGYLPVADTSAAGIFFQFFTCISLHFTKHTNLIGKFTQYKNLH